MLGMFDGSLVTGLGGLAAMALLRVGHHGGGHHAGSHHAGGHHGGHGRGESGARENPLWLLPSPVMVFAWMIGFGVTGIAITSRFPRTEVIAGAVLGAIVFERLLVRPIWDVIFKFVSTPGTQLQGSLATSGLAVTSFDAGGRGLVRLTVDGQDRDVLARATEAERQAPIRKGEKVFVENVIDADNSVVVSRQRANPAH